MRVIPEFYALLNLEDVTEVESEVTSGMAGINWEELQNIVNRLLPKSQSTEMDKNGNDLGEEEQKQPEGDDELTVTRDDIKEEEEEVAEPIKEEFYFDPQVRSSFGSSEFY